MALNTKATKLAQLINPQVMADMVDKKLVDLIKFSPLARIDMTLAGRPGTTVTLPSYTYIGDAADVTEGEDITIGQLTETSVEATIKSIGRGVQITDAAVLSGYGDPVSEAVDQLAMALAQKVDADVLNVLSAAPLTYSAAGNQFTADDIADALIKFGEDIEGAKVLLVSPETYGALRKADDWCPASEIAAQLVINGAVGQIHGCQVVLTNKLGAGKNNDGTTREDTKTAYIVKPGALAIYMKRGVQVESDRDILNKSTVITADEWYTAYLYDGGKAIKLTHA